MSKTDTDTKKHIAMYIGSLQKGGAERVMVNLAEYFFSQGYKVTLVTTYLAEQEYEVKHASWIRVPAGAPGAVLVSDTEENPVWIDPKGGETEGIQRVFAALLKSEQKGRAYNLRARSRKLRLIFKELKPDLVLSFIGKNNIMALSTATREGIKVVVSVRADPDMEYNTPALKAGMLTTFGRASGIVVQTTGALNWFPKFIREKCTILPNSINPSFIRKRYVGDREKSIVMVGRLDANKNQSMVMEAFKEATTGRFEDFRLIIYGDGPDRAKLQRKAVSLEIVDRVEFKGMVKHVAEHIEKAYMFILASDQEGMPNSLIEAMSLGIACISTDCPCGGPADLIQNELNGLLVPVGDTKAMSEAIRKLLENRTLTENLGLHAANVQNKYAPDTVNSMWKEYLDRIMH